MNWYLEPFKKYAVCAGRARRKEYWYFVFFNIIISVCLFAVDGIIGSYDAKIGLGLFGSIYILAILLPSICVSVRRLHDTGRSGWWMLIVCVPLIGPMILLVFMLLDSKLGRNKYGRNPKTCSSRRVASSN